MPERILYARPASFGRRVSAFVLDLVIITVAAFVVIALVQLPMSQETRESSSVGGIYVAIIVTMFAAYEWLLGATTGTLGMRALGMRIVTVGDRPLSQGATLLRTIVLLACGVSVVGLFSGLWHPEGRMWHDLASGTGVVTLGNPRA